MVGIRMLLRGRSKRFFAGTTKVWLSGGSRKKKRRKQLPLTTRQGILLALSIAALFLLIFVLVHYAYDLPLQKSLE